jgi:hypothetical protein
MHFTKYFLFISLLITSILSGGCQPEKPEPGGNLSIDLPKSLKARSLTGSCADSLWADVLIDNQAAQKLQRSGNNWQGSIKLTSNAHSLRIEFKCITENYGSVALATYTENINLSSDENLSLSSDRYEYPDNDQDGNSNLAEVKAGTDPGRPANGFKWANPLPQGNSLIDVLWNGSEYLAVGTNGSILTSGNGQSWSLSNSAAVNFLNGIAWSGTQYVIVGDEGTVLSRTPNDSDWAARDSGTKKKLIDVIWANNVFVAVGDATIVSSLDGVSWTHHEIPGVNAFSGITWTGDKFVVAGAAFNPDKKRLEGAIFTSNDGTSWSSPRLTGAPWLSDITWTGSQLVAVGGDTFTADGFRLGGIILTSPDGENWTQQVSGTDVDLYGVDYDSANGLIIAVGGTTNLFITDNPITGVVLSSADGINWISRDSTDNQINRSVASSGSETVVVGDAGRVKSSADLQQWSNHTSGTQDSIFDMVSTGDQVVAVGENGSVLTSPDGRSWASHNSGTPTNLFGVTWTGSLLVAVGGELSGTGGGVIVTSTDGISWTSQAPTTSFGLIKDVTWTGSQLVAVGAKGLILTSPDGILWTSRNSATKEWLWAVSSNNDQVVATGSKGVILTSSDSGNNWITIDDANEDLDLFGITWTGSSFVIAGGGYTSVTGLSNDTSIILTSTDGEKWTPSDPGVDGVLQDIEWTGSKLLAITENSYFLTSKDGNLWSATPTISSNGHYAVLEYQGTTLIGGGNGTILYQEN